MLVTLTSDNFDAFGRGIEMEQLPSTFRDAIRITREFAIDYVWIDCLYILQDSETDWEDVSRDMGGVYANSLLTISAAVSTNASYGILTKSVETQRFGHLAYRKLSDSSKRDTVLISARNEWPESSAKILSPYCYNGLNGGCWGGPWEGAVLVPRGWTLQENILPPRILIYGSQQIYWRCQHGFQAANGMPEHPDTAFGNMAPKFRAYIHASPENKNTLVPLPMIDYLKEYFELIQNYSCRSLRPTSCQH